MATRYTLFDAYVQAENQRAGSNSNGVQDGMKTANAVRNNNINTQQYPYPPINNRPDSLQGSQSTVPPTAVDSEVAQTATQVPETPSTSASGAPTNQSTSSMSSASFNTSTTSTSSSSTISTPTLRVLSPFYPSPSTTFTSLPFHPQATASLASSTTITHDSATEPDPHSSIQLSPTAIGLLSAVAAVVVVVVGACMIQCARRQVRRRRQSRSSFDFAEKNAWNSNDTATLSGRGEGSPSTIFGGKERTGLTPQPSWTTFHEAGRSGSASPYPLGLLPPPFTVQRAPSWRSNNGVGQLFHQQNLGPQLSGASKGNGLKQHANNLRPFEPPTITITNSSPQQSSQHLPQQPSISQYRHQQASVGSLLNSDTSSGHSFNRISVYTDPVHGTRIVKPPRLLLVNNDPSLSESDGGPRNSGWSSWDDSVGVALGVTIDRKHAPPRRRSRIPVSKAKAKVAPMRVHLAPVQEVSDTSETSKNMSSKSPTASNAHLYPGQLRRGPSSPNAGKRSPRPSRGTSPKPLKEVSGAKQPQAQRLYDLPRFEATSPGGNDSTRVASPSSAPVSPARSTGAASSRRQSKRASKRASSTRTMAGVRPSSTMSNALSETYAYVYSYAFSSTESEEIQIRRVSKRASGPAAASKQENEDPTRGLAAYMSSSPAVSDTVGALMIKAYDEEGSIPKPSIPHLKGKGKMGSETSQGRRKPPLGESNRVNVPNSSRTELRRVSVERTIRRQQQAGTRPLRSQRDILSPQSVYSEHPDHRPGTSASGRHIQKHGVPSLPPPGMPNLYQQKLMQEMPDYRSPTYSVYGMYRDENKASPLQGSPAEYTRDGSTRRARQKANGDWRTGVI
ncbi:hypothetical protein M408DRAFT_333030 [Serendipita vermifera MAFF 305830]|uniref:Transmembrane protein n=1 Tax=Serendipita vermifera MAFF 305830 TaxID=933852 RepID=A0A0C2WY07_SERVB|nr:hypothetical protein M408DRAFT_333030 [Serendipita vermifera MAFF 305830]